MLAKDEPLDDEIVRRAASFQRRQELRAVGSNEAIRIGDVQDDTQHDLRRYKIGLECIDRSMGQMRPGEFTVVGALTGFGKTSFLEQVGRANAIDYTVFMATLEMTEAEIQSNMIAREMGSTLEEFENERMRQSDNYFAALEKIRSFNLSLWRPPLGRAANIQTIFKQAERASADFLMIDYAALLDGWVPGNEAAKIVRYIQAQAKQTGIHTMLLAQLSFDALGKRPTLAHMEDTKLLNKSPSTVILLHRPFAGRDPNADVVAEIILAKQRKGKMFRGHTHWFGPTHTFYSMTREEEAQVQCCKKRVPKSNIPPTLAQSAPAPQAPPPVDEDPLDEELPF